MPPTVTITLLRSPEAAFDRSPGFPHRLALFNPEPPPENWGQSTISPFSESKEKGK